MVIDKWTRTSNNNSLAIPLLGHKSKETFSELKKEYERLKNLNHKFKKNSNHPSSTGQNNRANDSEIIDDPNIKEYIDNISSILFSINELISENNNYEKEQIDKENKEIDSILEQILIEYNLFMKNIKETDENINTNNNFDINSNISECQMVAEQINKKLQKDKNEENNIIIQEPRRININNGNINRNIDRGHINLLTCRREYNNSVEIVKNNIQYTFEEDGLSNGIKLSLFFMIVLFVLFICYICIS